jgi:thymidine phosphorylase
MIFLAGRVPTPKEGEILCAEAIRSGKALERFRMLLESQGAGAGCIDFPEDKLPLSPERTVVRSKSSGKIASFETNSIGTALRHLGGGRQRKEDEIDHGVAIEVMAKIGEEVAQGDPVFTLYHRGNGAETASRLLEEAFTVSMEAASPPIVLEVVG